MTKSELVELDQFIAEKVMGWQKCAVGHLEHKDRFAIHRGGEVFIHDRGNFIKPFNPTTDPAASLEVLKKCAENGIQNGDFKLPVSIFRRGDLKWVVSENFEDEEDPDRVCIVAEAPTLELAIALFAKSLFSKSPSPQAGKV